MASSSIPCIEFPNPAPLKISLPFGGELKSVLDLSKGPPSDCTLIQGLMFQLFPALAGLECFFKVMNVFKVLSDIKDPAKVPTGIIDVAAAAADLVATCLPLPIKFACMILDILKLIIAYLKCLIQAVESILNFQVGIDLSSAEGNPVLLASFDCARNNAKASMEQLKQALALIQPLLKILQPIIDIAADALPGPAKDALKAIPEILASLDSVLEGGGASVGVSGGEDVLQTLKDLKSTLQQLQETLDAIPC